MTTFVWKDEYSTGIKDIDEQHKKLSGFVDQLGEVADQTNIDARKAKRKIVLLGAYTRTHFAYLEEWMFKNGHYLSEQAKNVDREFLEFYETSRNQINKEVTKELLEKLHETIKTWLVNHIDMVNKAICEEPSTPDFHELPLSVQVQSNLLGVQQKSMRAFA